MANYTSRISTTAVSALNAQQAAIATTANNIANVNTPGYARRVLELEARAGDSVASGISLGSGVQVGSITRQTSAYLDELVRKAAGSNYRYEVEDSFISGVEPLFSFEGDFITIGSSLNAFYASMNDLALNPSDLSLRANVIQQADTLVNSIRTTFESIAQLQVDADNRLETELNTVNSITAQIAELNAEIRTRESTGYLAADERDQRERLLEKLAEKLSFSITNLQDGTITVSLANGFALVAGNNSRALDFSRNPSFAPGGVPQSLSSGNLGYIVYDHGGGSHQDLTGLVAAG
ncbi:MAG: flagellar hook-associated protein FlgK, partial [Deltaproteobacteria bacterium]|nr:flagellar hook-associated protein FlgK [Deltaproteobacteria bacterium]